MIKNILKGVIIGLANIIPGVSGGTMAVSMGIYDKLIHCISHLFTEFKKNVLFLLPIFVGMVIAVVGSAFGIDYLFETFPIQTNLLFVGLILGSLPAVGEKIKGKSIKVSYLIPAILFFVLVVGMALMNGSEGNAIVIGTGVWDLVKLFFVGLIAAATMVVPGVSGSMMLLLLGYYNPILDSIKSFIVAVFDWDMDGILTEMLKLIPFGIGVIVGIVLIAKIIEVIFEKYPTHAYWAILGLILASPIAILMVGTFPTLTVVRVITGAILLAVGFFISVKLGEK